MRLYATQTLAINIPLQKLLKGIFDYLGSAQVVQITAWHTPGTNSGQLWAFEIDNSIRFSVGRSASGLLTLVTCDSRVISSVLHSGPTREPALLAESRLLLDSCAGLKYLVVDLAHGTVYKE